MRAHSLFVVGVPAMLIFASAALGVRPVRAQNEPAYSPTVPSKVMPAAAHQMTGAVGDSRAAQARARLKRDWEVYLRARAAGVSAAAAPSAADAAVAQLRAPRRLDLALEARRGLARPVAITSDPATKTLTATLTVAYAASRIGNDPVWLRNYNGQLVGPTLRANPGDTLKIKLVNNLPSEPPATGHDGFHGFNTTNLHTHGLHVDPTGASDNVLIEIAPGDLFDYTIAIPNDHPSGTFWYHAHKHGSVAAQVSSGMAGALVIEGTGLDLVTGIKGVAEQIFVFQQIPYVIDAQLNAGVVELEYVDQEFGPGTWDQLGRFTTINGQNLPVINIRPGEVQRWRLIHAGVRESILAKLMKVAQDNTLSDGPPLHQIAADGLPLGKIATPDSIELEPGYRADVLVQIPDKGTYILIDERSPSSRSLLGNDEPRKYLARVLCDGDPAQMNLPNPADLANLRLKSIDPGSVTGTQTSTYLIDTSMNPIRFEIDGKVYDPANPARTLKLGKTEEWTIRGAPVAHPFHIHVNPFEVISMTDGAGHAIPIDPIWKDTILMPANGSVKFRTRYDVFTGKFVQHCHILDHEDQGMMQLIEIVP